MVEDHKKKGVVNSCIEGSIGGFNRVLTGEECYNLGYNVASREWFNVLIGVCGVLLFVGLLLGGLLW